MDFIITDQDFALFSKLVYDKTGINLHYGKKQLLQSRVNKVLRKREIPSYRAYYEIVKKDSSGQELIEFINLISTNVTHFFREEKHFDFIKQEWFNNYDFKSKKSVKVWSAACSSGEEPYSIAITLKELLGESTPFEIYSSDISTKVLNMAQKGVYPFASIEKLNEQVLKKYFMEGKNSAAGYVKVKDNIKKHVTFHKVNLIEPFRLPFKFDIIFCRNVMIYFDLNIKELIVNKFFDVMNDNSYLLIGHSESLNGVKHSFNYVMPATYKKD